MRHLLEGLSSTGIDRAKIERFLDGEPEPGGGTVRDLMAAEMANQLLSGLGQRPSQSGADAKRLRERGFWRSYDQRPDDDGTSGNSH